MSRLSSESTLGAWESTFANGLLACGRETVPEPWLNGYVFRDLLLEHLMRTIAAELQQGAPRGRLYAEQLLQTVAVHLVTAYTVEQPMPQVPRGGLPSEHVVRIEDYVRARLSEEIRLADLAEQAFLSEYHFCRIFKTATGETPAAYVQRVRMEEGARLP